MELKFNGAARTVTGSCHLITLDDGFRILLDCGLFQGEGKPKETWKLNNKWFFDPATIDCVILSHSHIDHSGRIPKLFKDGFRGKIYSTHATRSLAAIMLLDSAKIQEYDAIYYNKRQSKKRKKKDRSVRIPLYESIHVGPTLNLFNGLPYDQWFNVHDKVEAIFTDAGHILGSACVTLKIKQGRKKITLGFTADIGRPNRPILRDPAPMPPCDFVICESTYGDKNHESPPQQSDTFLETILETCVKNKGKLIIPAFSVGRTQEIVYMLDQMETKGVLPKIPVYVDSPLAINATTIFGAHPECYDNSLNEYLLIDPNPFGFNTLNYVRDANDSKALNGKKEPCIIISSSGMGNAGRVKHHLRNNIEDPKVTILIVGYCSPSTPGGKLRAGAETIRLFGEDLKVNAQVKVMDSFSAHADQSEMIDFLKVHKKKIKKLFLVHGEYETQKAFKYKLVGEGYKKVEIPDIGFEYDIN